MIISYFLWSLGTSLLTNIPILFITFFYSDLVTHYSLLFNHEFYSLFFFLRSFSNSSVGLSRVTGVDLVKTVVPFITMIT